MSSTSLSATSLARTTPRILRLSIDRFAPRTLCQSSRLQSTSAPPPPPPSSNTPPPPKDGTHTTPPQTNTSPSQPQPQPNTPQPPHDGATIPSASTPSKKPIHTLTPQQKAFLSSALRVNQTGELAAILIYAAQTPILTRSHPHLRPLMKHMYDQEAGHFSYFNTVLSKHRIRPTAMYPVWYAAASLLGWGTAVMGREAAMACTEAVETEIGTHYNEQVGVLLDWARKCVDRGETLGPELDELVGQLRRIRDEELEHLDHAVENDAKEARPYELLTEVIRGGCRGAIWVSERV